jgi:hypothetical protein
MNKCVAVLWINRTELVRISTRIPHSVDQVIVAMEPAGIVPKLVIFPMRHGTDPNTISKTAYGEKDRKYLRELHSQFLNLYATGSVMQYTEVSEGTALMLPIYSIVTWTCNMKPQSFVDSSVCCCITPLS